MDLMFLGFLSLLAGAILSVAVRSNPVRIGLNLLSQVVTCSLLLPVVIPVLMGAEPVTGSVEWSYPVDHIDLRLDPLGAFFLAFSLPITLLCSLYAAGYLSHDIRSPRHVGTHFALLSMMNVSFLIVYTVQNAFAFLVGWEIAALSAWLLVIWDHRSQKIRFAGFNYLISTHVGLLFLVAAIMMMHGETNSFQFVDFQTFFKVPSYSRNIVFVLLVTSFGLKSGFFPFHTFVPRAESAAPSHVAALMSGVVHKMGLFGMAKVLLMIGEPELWMGWYLLSVSTLSTFMGVLYTVSQRDMKRLLGYSSTENVGIIGIGFGMGCLGLTLKHPALAVAGFAGGILHILNHALFKSLLFLGAGSIYRFTQSVDLEKLGGLMKSMRWTGPLFLVGCLASAALPPLNGFVSEFILYRGLMQSTPELGLVRLPLMLVAGVMALVGGVSVLTITRLFGLVFLGSPRNPIHPGPQSRENSLMILPMLILVLGILILGFCPMSGITLIQSPIKMFLALSSAPQEPLISLISTKAIDSLTLLTAILLGIFAGLFLLRKLLLPRCKHRHVTWGCGYTLPSTRMQYTGSSFSQPIATVFRDLLKFVTRDETPQSVFPKDGKYETHCIDVVERTMFKLLAKGENFVALLLDWIPEGTRLSFWLGLGGLLILVVMSSQR